MPASAVDLVQQTLLGEAVEACPAAILVADDDGRLLAVNRYACDLLGYAREELLALNVTEIAPEAEVCAVLDELIRRQSVAGRTQVRTKDGGQIPVTYRASATYTGGTELWVSVVLPD